MKEFKEFKVSSKKHGEFIVLVSLSDWDDIKHIKWHVHHCGRSDKYYIKGSFKIDGVWKSIRLHRYILKAPAGMVVDHIKGDTLDNRRENLRICTHSENMKNSKKSKNNHRSKGVYFNQNKNKKYRSCIRVNKKQIYLGSYHTEEEAAAAYNQAAIKYHGEYARLNVIGQVV